MGRPPEPFTVAILGCGAAVELLHAPALDRLGGDVVVTRCVDVHEGRARHLAERFGAASIRGGVRELLAAPPTDGVIVALPNRLHAAASTACLLAGRHVLCEKPGATTRTECDEIESAATAASCVFTVNLLRRRLPGSVALRDAISRGELGEVMAFDVAEGGWGWPSRSGFQFAREAACGGVTRDRGPHVFDLLTWMLGDALVTAYADDTAGGVEATSLTSLAWSSGSRARIRISKVEPWPATVTVTGENGALAVWDLAHPGDITLRAATGQLLRSPAATRAEEPSLFLGAVATMIRDWVGACRHGTSNPAPIDAVRTTCHLIDRCYTLRSPLRQPWLEWRR